MTNGNVPPVPPPPPGQPRQAPRPNVPEKKGLPPLAWVGIGCAGLVFLGAVISVILGMFVVNKVRQISEDPAEAARVLVSMNPDIEIVNEDEGAGTITFREKSSGEEVTISYEDLKEGRIAFTTDEGTAAFDIDVDGSEDGEARMTIETDEGTSTFRAGSEIKDMPGWVPMYPGTDPEGGFTTETAELQGGTYTAKTSDSVEDVLDYFADQLESEGLAIKSRTTTPDGAMLTAESDDQDRSASIILGSKSGATEIIVQYADKR